MVGCSQEKTGAAAKHLPIGYPFMLRLRQIDLLFHIIVIECPYSCIPCTPMYTLYTLYTHVYPSLSVYLVYPCIYSVPMFTLVILDTLYTPIYHVYSCLPQ